MHEEMQLNNKLITIMDHGFLNILIAISSLRCSTRIG